MIDEDTVTEEKDGSIFNRWAEYLSKHGVNDMKYAQWEQLKDFLVKQEGYPLADVVTAARNYDIKKGQAVGLKKGRQVISDVSGANLDMDRKHIFGYTDKIISDMGLSIDKLVELANVAIDNGAINELTSLEKFGLAILAARGKVKVK